MSKSFSVYNVLFGQPIGFISPLSLEECVKRLEAKSERTGNGFFSNRRKLLVKVSPGDDFAYHFKMERDAGRNLNVEVVGELSRHERNMTRVSGRARISRSFYLIVGLIFVIHVAVFGIVADLRPFLALSALAVAISWVFVALERSKLERVVYNTLSDQIT